MVADKSAENTPNAQIAAKLTAQDQKFGILKKKLSLGVFCPCTTQ